MIYDDLEIELNRLCEELEIDMSKLPESFPMLSKIMNIKSLALHFHVCEKTISYWRKKAGITQPKDNAIDYTKMDALIHEGKTTREIMAVMGCAKSTVTNRKYKLGYGKRKPIRVYGPEVHVEAREAIQPISERLELKRKNLHMTKRQFESWLPGVAGKQFMGEQPVGTQL